MLFIPVLGIGQNTSYELSANYLGSFKNPKQDRSNLYFNFGFKRSSVTIGIFSGIEVSKNAYIPVGGFIEKEFTNSRINPISFAKVAYQFQVNGGYDKQLDIGAGLKFGNVFSIKTSFCKRNYDSFLSFGCSVFL